MNSVTGLMRGYFYEPKGMSLIAEGVPKPFPIVPKKATWKATQDGNALLRTYEFKSKEHLRRFVDQLLAMQDRIEHTAQILIEDKSVKVKVTTKSLNRITEMDTEYAAEADHIFTETKGDDND